MADNGDDDSHCRIKEGDYVVLKRGDIFKAAQIQLKKKVIFEKQWIYLDNAVGHFYRTTFEIGSGGTLLLKTPKEMESSTAAKEAGADNRNIVDDGKSQKLTRDDIEMLKEQGLKGQEIIQQLIDNSSTFKDKTEYAQDKYIKKKKKKYENTVTILKPSCRILAMMYHGREPGKICHLRHDTLAQMLTLANIHAGSKVLVFETCSGLVLGAVMERMGGFGSVIQMYPGGTLNTKTKDPSIDSEKSVLTAKDVQQDKADVKQQGSPEEQSREASSVANTSDDQEKEDREKRKEAKAQERKAKLEEKRKKMAAAAALLDGRNADGLVIAGRFHPCPVLLGLLKFLAPSRPFVVYSQHKEPLIECYTKLKEVGGTVSLRLTDTWLRHYQVMPNRTHPLLLMSGGGGYLLSGTTVAVDHSKPAGSLRAEEPAPKRLKLTNTEG
uniref:tRNA (adenine(58)-N(1))-methyltransferase non-catalytic subunit TRM6 n=1 Tax=Takifugu rubripes TaxID=31033 RepID=H2SYU5_TAKRU